MATSNFFVVLSLSLTFFLVLLTKANSTETLSFTFKKFKPNQPNLIFQGDALATSSGKLQLTKVDESGAPAIRSLGRALYTTPVQIWDGETGNIASFASSFSVIVKVPENSKSADGFAFFLAPIDSQPQNKSGFLGLFNGEGYNKSLQTVAVEFDTYKNAWDPQNPRHIGIDVNSVKSIKTQPWGLANGQVAKILITYDASTTLLAASLIHPSRRMSYILAEKVDLKSVLPEWVRIGFSATTGSTAGYTETHDVLSWSFASKLSEYSTSDDLDLASFMLHEAI